MSQAGTGAALGAQHVEKLEGLSADMSCDNFRVIGGAALDLLVNQDQPTKDIDIAIEADTIDPDRVVASLEQSGYDIDFANRPYAINWSDPVRLIMARRQEALLDISIVPTFASIGQFTLHTVNWSYPDLAVNDDHGILQTPRERYSIVPTQPTQLENPYLLTSQVFKLAAKYGLSLRDHGALVGLLREDFATMTAGGIEDEFNAFGSCVSSLFGSIARSRNAPSFCGEVVETGLIDAFLPNLNGLLADAVADEAGATDMGLALRSGLSKNDLLAAVYRISVRLGDDRLVDVIDSMAVSRPWDIKPGVIKS